ncbi:uncharacterized protein si:ch211-198m1.1 [Danio aesculapii]|uniref:uncharacterized protein si:ch211-198m1.1 n=1 Tax=Danio aesculapii TaxID=1142201 RepID=UPI0024C0A518|nr:uncharacterized protein si:ch211-198m1.1 [Danio aesculapii]
MATQQSFLIDMELTDGPQGLLRFIEMVWRNTGYTDIHKPVSSSIPSRSCSIFSALPLIAWSFKFLGGPGPGRALVLLLIKATDAISLERVAQAALPLGNQFAMADAHGGKLACCPTAVLQKVSTIPLLTLLSSCFELKAVACSSFCRWTSESLNHLINQIVALKDALYI